MALRRRGVGKMTGSPFATVLAQASRLETINGMEPWVIITQFSPRMWSYGIRFYPVGRKWTVEYFTGNGILTDARAKGGYENYPVCRPGDKIATRRRR